MAAPPGHRQVDGSGRRARNRQGSRKGSLVPGERYLPISHCPNEPSRRSRLGSKGWKVVGNRARPSPRAPQGGVYPLDLELREVLKNNSEASPTLKED